MKVLTLAGGFLTAFLLACGDSEGGHAASDAGRTAEPGRSDAGATNSRDGGRRTDTGEGEQITSQWRLFKRFPYVLQESLSIHARSPAEVSVFVTQSLQTEPEGTAYVLELGLEGGVPFERRIFRHEARYRFTVRHLADRTAFITRVINQARTYSLAFWVDRDGTAHEAYNAMWGHNVGRSELLPDGRAQTLSTINALTYADDRCQDRETVWLRTRPGEPPDIRCIRISGFDGARPIWDQSPDGTYAAGFSYSHYGELHFSGDGYTSFDQVLTDYYDPRLWGVVPLEDGGYGTLFEIKPKGEPRAVYLLTHGAEDGGITLTPQEQLNPGDGPSFSYIRHKGFWVYVEALQAVVFDPKGRRVLARYPPPPPPTVKSPLDYGGFYLASDGERLYQAYQAYDREAGATEVWVRQLTELDHIFPSQ